MNQTNYHCISVYQVNPTFNNQFSYQPNHAIQLIQCCWAIAHHCVSRISNTDFKSDGVRNEQQWSMIYRYISSIKISRTMIQHNMHKPMTQAALVLSALSVCLSVVLYHKFERWMQAIALVHQWMCAIPIIVAIFNKHLSMPEPKYQANIHSVSADLNRTTQEVKLQRYQLNDAKHENAKFHWFDLRASQSSIMKHITNPDRSVMRHIIQLTSNWFIILADPLCWFDKPKSIPHMTQANNDNIHDPWFPCWHEVHYRVSNFVLHLLYRTSSIHGAVYQPASYHDRLARLPKHWC